ncbi:MAG TPA: hypothetical protein VH561_14435 [Micromonosporaceae bacterium]|jgi:hypothetical protein
MKRRTIDLVVSAGGLLLAVILLVGGLVFTSNANFAKTYVRDQLSQQKITFPTVEAINANPETAGTPCLLANAGQPMTTGKQAECYANNFIGVHLKGIADGKTYAELGDVQTDLRNQIAALPAGDPRIAGLQDQLNTVNTERDTVFKGETLRGLLLTSYGFSELGAKAALGATVAYIGSGLLFLLAALGFWHGWRTPQTQAFAAVEAAGRRERAGANA